MSTFNKLLLSIIVAAQLTAVVLATPSLHATFVPPSHKQMAVVPYSQIESSYSLRKVKLGDRSVYEMIANNEIEGFLGYHGDSLDFLIYQDIIRIVMEEIVELPVKKNFHFLAVPLDPVLEIQTKAQLAQVFTEHDDPAQLLYETTFPLNFTIWGNHNRLGLNTIENFTKDEPVKPLGYKKRLKWFFGRLGIKESHIDDLFKTANEKLPRSTGVILQFFDESTTPYAFAKKIAYPAYPNGYIAENRTVDEYYEDESYVPPYPHEVRLLLSNKRTLNPSSPLKIVRYTPHLSGATLASYEKALRDKVKQLKFNKSRRDAYKIDLLATWGAKAIDEAHD